MRSIIMALALVSQTSYALSLTGMTMEAAPNSFTPIPQWARDVQNETLKRCDLSHGYASSHDASIVHEGQREPCNCFKFGMTAQSILIKQGREAKGGYCHLKVGGAHAWAESQGWAFDARYTKPVATSAATEGCFK